MYKSPSFPSSWSDIALPFQMLKSPRLYVSGKHTDDTYVQVTLQPHKANLGSKEICTHKILKLHTVQLLQKFKVGKGKRIPFRQKSVGEPCKISDRTRKLLRRQMEVDSSLTGHKLLLSNTFINLPDGF